MPPDRLFLSLKSSLRSNPTCRCVAAVLLAARGACFKSCGAAEAVKKIGHYCSAVRLLPDNRLSRTLEKRLVEVREHVGLNREAWTMALTRPAASTPALLQKSVILKPRISAEEPGVIFISFEHQWAQLLRLPNVEQLAQDYTLVVSPTWSPPHSPLNVVFPALWPKPVHCLISHDNDLATLPRLSSNYRMIPLLASNWVNEKVFAPRVKGERDLDLVMVANFAPFKRHVRFFQALQNMPRDLKVLLIGQKDGNRDENAVLKEAEAFCVRDRFELRTSMPHAEVLQTLCRAKASAVLSLREGSCVAVAESLFADTPTGLVKGAHIGSAKFINDATGMFLREDNLAEDLMTLIARSETMRPREWALRNGIGARMSSVALNEHLKAHALADGKPWTRDLARMQWCPNPRRLDVMDDTWADEEHAQITSRFGVMIGTPVQK